MTVLMIPDDSIGCAEDTSSPCRCARATASSGGTSTGSGSFTPAFWLEGAEERVEPLGLVEVDVVTGVGDFVEFADGDLPAAEVVVGAHDDMHRSVEGGED